MDLLLRFRRARTGHDDHLVTADPDIVYCDDRVLRFEGAARAFVRLGDAQHLVNAVEDPDQLGIDLVRADHAEHGSRDARRPVDVHPQLDEALDHGINLRLRGALAHDDDHVITLRLKDQSLLCWNPIRARLGALRR